MPLNPVTEANLNPYECLWPKAGAVWGKSEVVRRQRGVGFERKVE
jgi:hypothetical protein